MTDPPLPDHYEALQISPRADADTIQRVFRHLAKRFHPDNAESGDAARFSEIMSAFEVLSDPAARARYDAGYERSREARWREESTAEVPDIAAHKLRFQLSVKLARRHRGAYDLRLPDRALDVFPALGREIFAWLARQAPDG